MTGLFGKITDQMIINCKDCITGKDNTDVLWDKVRSRALTGILLHVRCVRLCPSFVSASTLLVGHHSDRFIYCPSNPS